MTFISENIKKTIYNLDLSDTEKFKLILRDVDEEIDNIRNEEYDYGKDEGYSNGWDDAKLEFQKDIQNPKKTIQDIFEAANYDDITLKELFKEFKLQMKIKNLL